MKSVLLLIFCLLASCCYAQSVQTGQVFCYQGVNPKTPLPNVAIAATNASAVISDEQGAFSLSFRTLHPGDAIQFKRVELAGYEVMNQEALENARVAKSNADLNPNLNLNPNADLLRPQDARTEGSNPNANTLTIVMVRREMLRQLRDGYRSVASQRYEKQLKATEAQLEQMRKEGRLAEEQYNARMDSLEADYEEKLSKLESYIDKFARIDLSDLDADEQQIISLVQAGDFDEALKIYESQNLAQRLKQSREDQAKLLSAHDQLTNAAQQKQKENERLRASIARQVILLKMAGGEENYHKVHQILHATYLADTTDYEARKDYALVLRQRGDYADAIALLRNGVDSEKDLYARGLMMIDLIGCYCYNGQEEEAFRLACYTDSLLTPIQENRYGVSTRCLPVWSRTQLDYLIGAGRMEECRPIVERLQREWAPDTLQAETSLMSYVDVIRLLSDYYSIVNDVPHSLWAAKEAMRLGRILNQNVSWSNVYGSACATACQTYIIQSMQAEAIDAADRGLASLRQLVDKAATRSPYVTATLAAKRMIEVMVPAEEYALADSIIQFVNEYQVADHLKPRTGDGSLENYGMYRLYELQCLLHHGKTEEAEKMLQESMCSLSHTEIADAVQTFLLPEIQARIHLARGQYKEALHQCNAVVGLNADAYEESQDAWDADNLCRVYLLQHDILQSSGQKKEAQKALQKAEKVAIFPSNQKLINSRK